MADDNNSEKTNDFWQTMNRVLDKGTALHQDKIRKSLSPTMRTLGKSALPDIPKMNPRITTVLGSNPTKMVEGILPWNTEFSGYDLNTPKFYTFKEEEHTGRVIFGDEQAVAYDQLVEFTNVLNKALQRNYPDKYYTVDDIYEVAKTHTAPWGQATYLGYKDAFMGTATDSKFWEIIGKLGNFKPVQFGKLPDLIVPDTERGTGRTMRLVFWYCHALLENPNKWITIRDHSSAQDAHVRLARRVQEALKHEGIRVEHYEFRDPHTGHSIVDLKANLTGSPQYERNKLICNPRTLSTPETSPKS